MLRAFHGPTHTPQGSTSAPASSSVPRSKRSSAWKSPRASSVIAKCAMQTSRAAQADGVVGESLASARRKNVSSKPKRRPSSAARWPVKYHHSVWNVGCGP
jgi:hypothetical protein